MITVTISINGLTIHARSARNTLEKRDDKTVYKVDDGSEILHKREDGAIKLAKKLLDCIKEM